MVCFLWWDNCVWGAVSLTCDMFLSLRAALMLAFGVTWPEEHPEWSHEEPRGTAGTDLGGSPLSDGWKGMEEGAGLFFSPHPFQHPFSWQNYHPLFLLAALLQVVCLRKTKQDKTKKHIFFGQAVLTGIWPLNSNHSLITFLPAIQNLPGLLVHFGIGRDVSH